MAASPTPAQSPAPRPCPPKPRASTPVAGAAAPAAVPRWGIVLHGGAGNINPDMLTPERQASYRATMEEALRWVTNVEEFKMRLRGITSGTAATMAAAASAEITRFGS